ncbi:hypothetical protein A8C56_20945 [Niabella ginsenosidivorans]|uniref:Uncharacterized protein n=1 Tax=Niabella ginsenosidivorans TaxID=1176587 RepID=A0A1A9I622_9BACT|nr:hypothetical protein A8C56_20945 [Niabella ginsenosidivorans]
MILPNPVLLYVVHIPDLIDHFQLHQKEFGQVSVIDFVMEHLGDEQHHHHNAHAHDRLPFNHHTISHSPTPAFFTGFNDSDFRLQKPVDVSPKIMPHLHFYSTAYIPAVWQPPKQEHC